jgi:two-component system OmpR family response regulator
LAENNAKNVVLFGELDDASLRLSLYHSGVALVLRKPEGANEIVAALGVIAIEKADAPRISSRVIPFPVQTSGESSWQLESLRRELVSPDGKTIALTRNEVKVCLALAAEPSEPTNREALTRSLYGRFDSPANRALDAVIKRLRQKIVATVNTVDPITTHYGEGHRFTAPIVVVSQ